MERKTGARKVVGLIFAGIGLIGISGAACFPKSATELTAEQKKEQERITKLPPVERFLHDYVGTGQIGSACLKDTNYDLSAKNGKRGLFIIEKNKAGETERFTMKPGDSLEVTPQTAVLHFDPDSHGGAIPYQSLDSETSAVLTARSCPTSYDWTKFESK